jgi:hypothetical protein
MYISWMRRHEVSGPNLRIRPWCWAGQKRLRIPQAIEWILWITTREETRVVHFGAALW